ncbi:hypothetical protein AB1Y20_013646 [Prymnesium parvum]|uniref:Uncharacterized protein n=1 Tax=Prymnesium parvum TaxID=97485 RepID=A0AB34IGV9_PRYPA
MAPWSHALCGQQSSHMQPHCPTLGRSFFFVHSDRASYEAIINILRSLKSVKGVVIEVKSEIFGVAWAQSTDCPQPTIFPEQGRDALCSPQRHREGKSLELRLKNYEDGRPRPELYVPPPPKEGQTGPGDLESDEDEDESGDGGGGVLGSGDGGDDGSSDEDSDDEAANGSPSNSLPRKVIDEGQVWRRRHPHHVKIDSREAPRAKPSLNQGDIARAAAILPMWSASLRSSEGDLKPGTPFSPTHWSFFCSLGLNFESKSLDALLGPPELLLEPQRML